MQNIDDKRERELAKRELQHNLVQEAGDRFSRRSLLHRKESARNPQLRMMRSNSSMSSIYSQDANLGGFNRSSVDLSAVVGKQQTISGATLGVQPTLKRGAPAQDGPTFGLKAHARSQFVSEDREQGVLPLEDVIHQMKGNTLNRILRATDQKQHGNALADEQMQMRAIYTNDAIKYKVDGQIITNGDALGVKGIDVPISGSLSGMGVGGGMS